MFKPTKFFLRIAAVLFIVCVALILCISPIAKYLLEKHDIALTGREITVGWVYVNPITGYAYLSNLAIHEEESDSVFLSANGLGVNVALFKLLFSTLEFSEVTLTKPRGSVMQSGKHFNFNDLIEKFTPEKKGPTTGFPEHFQMQNLSIVNGEFHYNDLKTEVYYFVKNVNVHSPGFSLEADTLPLSFDLEAGIGTGKIKGEFNLTLSDLDYRLAINIDSLDLDIINQYLRELVNYGVFAALLDVDMHLSGKLDNVKPQIISGNMAVSDFHFGKTTVEEYVSFEKLSLSIVEINPKERTFQLDSISLDGPFFRYELYDDLDNVQTMFGKKGSNVTEAQSNVNQFNLIIEIAELVKKLFQDFLRSDYEIGHVSLDDGHFEFADYSLSRKFLVGLIAFNAHADSVEKSRKRIELFVHSDIRPYGDLRVILSINPKDTGNFDLDYRFREIAMSSFNAYMITHTSFPIDRGILNFSGEWHVSDGAINSENHLVLLDTRVSDRVKTNDITWIPMPLVLALIDERGNSIDYEIPITGNLNDPNFHLSDVLLDLLKNIFVKPVTTPYRMEVKNVEQKLEQSLAMPWDVQQHSLTSAQEDFISEMVDFLKAEPNAQITVQPVVHEELENEIILMFEAKKLFLISAGEISAEAFSDKDSLRVVKLSIKDPAFIQFLKAQTTDKYLYPLQHQAAKMISTESLAHKLNLLNQSRRTAFLQAFEKANVSGRVNFTEALNKIPFNGFSYFDITYSGGIPDYLKEAMIKLNEFNSKNPRKEYRKIRRNQTP